MEINEIEVESKFKPFKIELVFQNENDCGSFKCQDSPGEGIRAACGQFGIKETMPELDEFEIVLDDLIPTAGVIESKFKFYDESEFKFDKLIIDVEAYYDETMNCFYPDLDTANKYAAYSSELQKVTIQKVNNRYFMEVEFKEKTKEMVEEENRIKEITDKLSSVNLNDDDIN